MMKTVAIITALCLIGAIILLIKGFRDAKEIFDDSEGLTQGEIDAFKMSAEDKHLSDLIDRWGKKKFGKESIEEIVAMPDKKKASQMLIDRSENKREFTNRSNVDEVDLSYFNKCQ